MIEFSSSLKLNQIDKVDSSFNEDTKNITFFQGGLNFGGGTAGKFREIDNNRDIYCYADWGWSVSKEYTAPTSWYQNPCDASTFLHGRRKKRENSIFRPKFDYSFGSSPSKI